MQIFLVGYSGHKPSIIFTASSFRSAEQLVSLTACPAASRHPTNKSPATTLTNHFTSPTKYPASDPQVEILNPAASRSCNAPGLRQ
ncbi:uncharacterized protein AKAW2_60958S [Aspergillus luchuensis]|uniref:Uncharacterized protein n=1 Tax=Aspergillus kawachii TaxID=1069201 RepID=A0A7R8A1G7_ASPKA|nr:uncharacterized protein AKAW2_60958S [Aspergillus luchuensis]BCS02694.1 hypothetical protein AKAW2_60958S [Aspergillus luchuensis]